MRLSSLQDTYLRAIYHTDTKPLEALIYESNDFTKQARIDVYRNNTTGSLKSALSQVFPVCELLVGVNYFGQLATSHVLQYPSRRRNLDLYGETFPATIKSLIKEHEELEELAYLADVAQLEWLLHQSYFAPDRICFDIEKFATLTAEQQMQVSFKLAKDIVLVDSPYPIYDIWQSHQKEDANFNAEIDADVQDNPHHYVLVQRKEWQPHPKLIDEGLYRLLLAIYQGTTLLELTNYLEKSSLDIATLIQQGLVSGFNLKSSVNKS